MRFLVIGLGSMGKRRIRNLRALGHHEIIGFDVTLARAEEVARLYGITTTTSLPEALQHEPDAFIISTPPDAHTQYAAIAVDRGKPCFIEASVIKDGLKALNVRANEADVLIAPSCTMRFHPAVRAMKAALDSGRLGRVLTFAHHFGEHLSRWHPWEDFKTFYVSKKETGGCREIVPFELVWLTWLCGPISSIAATIARTGIYDLDLDDVYQLQLAFESGCLGQLQVDIVQKVGYRSTRLVCETGVITWDWDTKQVTILLDDGSREEVQEQQRDGSPEGFYIDEMEAFVRATTGEAAWPHPLDADCRILDALETAESSATEMLKLPMPVAPAVVRLARHTRPISSVLFLITARSGSKGLPGKNLATIAGRTLVAYRCLSTRQVTVEGRLLISTDDQVIANEAVAHGADAPFLRPAHLSTGEARTDAAVLHAMDYILSVERRRYDAVMILQPTSPFVRPESYDRAVALMNATHADLVLSVAKAPKPMEFVGDMSPDGRIDALVESINRRPVIRRQAYPDQVVPNGALFLVRWDWFLANPNRYSSPETTRAMQVDPLQAIEIDVPLDLEFARYLADSGQIDLSPWSQASVK